MTDSPGWRPKFKTRNLNPEEAALQRGEVTLVSSASRRMQDALIAWSENDYERVALFAPIAVEHLGKAALWRTSPTLLVPLSREAEKALIALATKPDLKDPRVRTVGLDGVLERLARIDKGLALADDARKRMVSIRNGAVHVGASATSREVLLDALTLCQAILDNLGYKPQWFYGAHQRSATGLLDEKRTEVGDRVAARLARSERKLNEYREQLGLHFGDYVAAKETEADDLDTDLFGDDLWGIAQRCPECHNRGRLFGHVEVEPQVQEHPAIDEDTPPESYIAGWTIEFFPTSFRCCICDLDLSTTQEVAEGCAGTNRMEIEAQQLGYQFDPASYAEERYTHSA